MANLSTKINMYAAANGVPEVDFITDIENREQTGA